MLPKKNRADTKTVKEIFQHSKLLSLPNLNFKFLLGRSENSPKISFIAPKTVAKLAVKRNLLRRRGYSALAKNIDRFPSGLVGVFVFRKYEDSLEILEDEIKKILSKIN